MRAEYIVGGIVLTGLLASALILGIQRAKPESAMPRFTSAKTPYVEIRNPSGFLNTGENPDGSAKAISMKELVGKKVILVDFMTYSCINCQRTFPHLKAWYEKYKGKGLEIVAIHTPEFAFEKDIDNVREAMETYGITYPVVLDNDYSTWNAYGNRYWPRKYLVDINGNIVYDHIGEGGYEETERKIVELLAERARALGERVELDTRISSESPAGEARRTHSPEVYFGAERNGLLGNGVPGVVGTREYAVPAIRSRDTLYLDGRWSVRPEYAETQGNTRVVFRYNAREVYMVAESDQSVEVEVWQDGVRLGKASGEDVRDGAVRIGESRLYKIIQNPEAGEHELEIRIKTPGVRIYTFTFG